MNVIKLTDTTKFVRDPFSKGLISIDQKALGAYRAQRRGAEQLKVLESDINSMRQEFENLRKLLLTSLEHETP